MRTQIDAAVLCAWLPPSLSMRLRTCTCLTRKQLASNYACCNHSIQQSKIALQCWSSVYSFSQRMLTALLLRGPHSLQALTPWQVAQLLQSCVQFNIALKGWLVSARGTGCSRKSSVLQQVRQTCCKNG